MFPLPEQISSAAKSQLESQLQIFSTLTSKVFESAEKIIALNLNAGKAALLRKITFNQLESPLEYSYCVAS